MLPLVAMLTVTVQVPPPAATVQLLGDTEYGALSPLSVSVAAWLPLLVNVTAPVAAAAPLSALSEPAPLVVTAMTLPSRVPLTAAVTGPLLPPVAVSVREPWLPMLPVVDIKTVTVQALPASTLQLDGDSEKGALSPDKVSVAGVSPVLAKITVP